MSHVEVMKMALEALELEATSSPIPETGAAIAALRAALAQEEQAEPYCYVYEYDSAYGLHREFYPGPYNGKQKPDRTIPVYAAPPQRKPLTEDDIAQMWSPDPGAATRRPILGWHKVIDFARAIELAHGIVPPVQPTDIEGASC